MALVHDGMICVLCNSPIQDIETDEFFATTYFGIEDPLYALLDDAAVHQKCIDTWKHRDEFVAYYNAHCCNELRVTRSGRVVYRRSILHKLWWMLSGC